MRKILALLLAIVLVLAMNIAPAEEEKVSITFFLYDCGCNYPDGFDPNDNFMINQIAEWADVNFEKVYMPFSDIATQLRNLIAAGDMPDLVETAWMRDDLRKWADEGAFADISDLSVISENYTQAQINGMKSADGKIYVLDSMPIDLDPNMVFVRVDLLEKAGYEGFPTTIDEYLDAMRAVKEWDPDALVYVCRSVNYQQWFLTDPFNTAVSGWAWYEERGKYCNTWEGDNIIKSVEFAKQLYDEGLLDPEFVTNDGNTVNQKRLNDNCLIWAQNRGGIYARMQILAKTEGQQDARFIPTMGPVDETCGRDGVYTAPGLYGGYDFVIKAGLSEEKYDACCRVIETLFSQNMYDLYVYGREGFEYSVNDAGDKEPIFPAADDNAWREAFGVAWTCNTTGSMNYFSKSAMYSSDAFTPEQKAQYYAEFEDAMTAIEENNLCKLNYSPDNYITKTDEISNAMKECAEKQKSLYVDAVIGNITVEDFEIAKNELVEKYQFVTDWYNDEIAIVLENYDLTYTK